MAGKDELRAIEYAAKKDKQSLLIKAIVEEDSTKPHYIESKKFYDTLDEFGIEYKDIIEYKDGEYYVEWMVLFRRIADKWNEL